MKRDWLIVAAALSGAIAIGAGAFASHGASGTARELLKTGGLYQMVHAVAAVALIDRARRPASLMLAGAAVFAFSLYALALGAPRIAGAITPFGGMGMIAGWLWLSFARRPGRKR
jgi:uncharacterized membrane protein YgdD (TMEM256/DUF423 family)